MIGEKRIPSAHKVVFGDRAVWVIPDDTEKPVDRRRGTVDASE